MISASVPRKLRHHGAADRFKSCVEYRRPRIQLCERHATHSHVLDSEGASLMSIESVDYPLPRCPWAGDDALYRHYHDSEWGRPVTSDTRLFEKICLEGFQSGLSWITILRKRERFREVFHG